MKVRLIRSDLGVPPGVYFAPGETPTEGLRQSAQIVEANGIRTWKPGTIFSGLTKREVQLLVGNGDADPVDDEAIAAVPNWEQGRKQVLLRREMLAKAIQPEHRELYLAGKMIGYDDLGRIIYTPGNSPGDDEDGENDDDETT